MLAADVVHGIVCSTENRPAELDSAPRFDRHAKHSDIPLLADFWAGWCGLCKAMTRVFERAAAELGPYVRF
jgi:thioredoxin 2